MLVLGTSDEVHGHGFVLPSDAPTIAAAKLSGPPKTAWPNAPRWGSTLKAAIQPALAKVFSPDEIAGINNVAADIARRSDQTAVKVPGGSNTVQDTHAAHLPGSGTGHTVSRVILDMIAAGIGEHLAPDFGSELGMVGGEMVNACGLRGSAASTTWSRGR